MLESLGFSSATFVITIINIVILCMIFRAILFKRVTKFMDDRAKRVRDSLEHAEKDKTQAKLLLEQYEDKLRGAEGEADRILRLAKEQGEKEAAQILAEGKAAAAALLENTRKQLEAERQAALAKFRVDAAALVVSASAKLVARDLNSEDNQHYANMMLEELATQKESN